MDAFRSSSSPFSQPRASAPQSGDVRGRPVTGGFAVGRGLPVGAKLVPLVDLSGVWFQGGGPGCGSRDVLGRSVQLKGWLAAMVAWAAWLLVSRRYVAVVRRDFMSGSTLVQRRCVSAGENTLSGFGRTDGGSVCDRRALLEGVVVVLHVLLMLRVKI